MQCVDLDHALDCLHACDCRPGFGAPSYSASAVSQLLSQCDFIGISAYAPLNGADFDTNALQVGTALIK